MRATSEDHDANTSAVMPRGMFVIVRTRNPGCESTPMISNVVCSVSAVGERTGLRFHQCFLRNGQCAGGIQYEVNFVHMFQCVCLN